jgi:hypothetical protein
MAKKDKGGFSKHFKLGLMGLATLLGGAVPNAMPTNAAPAAQQVQQTAQDKQQAPITNPVPIQARKQTAIGTAIFRKKRHTPRSIPQKHAKRHTNLLHASKKAKRKHRRR